MFSTYVFKAFSLGCMVYDITMYVFLLLEVNDVLWCQLVQLVLFSGLDYTLFFTLIPFKVHMGYLYLDKTFWGCSSCSKSCGLNIQLWCCGSEYYPHCILLRWYRKATIPSQQNKVLLVYHLPYTLFAWHLPTLTKSYNICHCMCGSLSMTHVCKNYRAQLIYLNHTNTLKVLEIVKCIIFLRPEEAMLLALQKLVSSLQICLSFRKIVPSSTSTPTLNFWISLSLFWGWLFLGLFFLIYCC